MIAPPDPRWPNGQAPWPTQPRQGGWWGWRGPQPVRDNQLGWRMPSGGQPAASNLPLLIALGFLILSPLILVSWLAACPSPRHPLAPTPPVAPAGRPGSSVERGRATPALPPAEVRRQERERRRQLSRSRAYAVLRQLRQDTPGANGQSALPVVDEARQAPADL